MNPTSTKNDDKNTKLQDTCIIATLRVLVQALMMTFLGALENFEKRLLASSCLPICPSVRLSAWNNSAPTGQIFVKFYI